MNERIRRVLSKMPVEAILRTSHENIGDVLEALDKLDGDRIAELEGQLAACANQAAQWAGLAGLCKGRMSRAVAWLRVQANAAHRTGDRAGAVAFTEAHNVVLAIHEDRVDENAFQLQARDLDKPAEEQGLFRKFIVYRVDGSDLPGGKHYGCDNFVLDLTHDPYALPAIQAYAAACAVTHPELAKDLFARYGVPPELTITGVERRRDLQAAPLPRDAEFALEHAAIALDKAGETDAHAQVVEVLAQHLPPEQLAASYLQPAEAPRAEGYVDQDDDQAFDREAERLTREMGLGGGTINPNATSVVALFLEDGPLTRCAAGRDGECGHPQCPQLRDGEPAKSGRHCPLDTQDGGE